LSTLRKFYFGIWHANIVFSFWTILNDVSLYSLTLLKKVLG